MTKSEQILRFHGGPLDGLELPLQDGIMHPSEIVWREAHIAPFHDCLYKLHVRIEIPTQLPVFWDYHYSGQSDLMATAAYWEGQAERHKARVAVLLEQLDKLKAKSKPRRKRQQ